MSPLTWSIKRGMVVNSIRRALHETGETAFIESQRIVPVDTGALKSSGSIKTVDEGIIIHYSKEYASHVEKGWEGGKIWTSSFKRASGATVRGHYKNQSPREGRHFIEQSLKKFFVRGLRDKTPFQENILVSLKSSFGGKSVVEK